MYPQYPNEEHKEFNLFFPDRFAENSVYICRTQYNDFLRLAILNIICKELSQIGFTARYVGDNIIPYHQDKNINREIYLRGCKYGIVLLERLPIGKYIPEYFDGYVLTDWGYMKQQGKKILILYDEDSMEMKNARNDTPSIYYPDPFEGLNKSLFYTSESELQTLKIEIIKWISTLKGEQNE